MNLFDSCSIIYLNASSVMFSSINFLLIAYAMENGKFRFYKRISSRCVNTIRCTYGFVNLSFHGLHS